MTGFTIRAMDAADAGDYRTIRLAALQAAPDAFSSTYEAEASRPLCEFADRLTTSRVFGARAAGELVGVAGFKQQTGAKLAHKGFVWGMYVHPHRRGEGVGSALLGALIGYADDRVENLTLTVTKGNDAAFALYRKHGFETYGIEPRALKGPAGYIDEILMVRLRPARGS